MLISLAEAFKLLLALFTDGKIEDYNAERSPESGVGFRVTTATPSLPSLLSVVIGKA